MIENGLTFSDEEINDLATILFSDVDRDHVGAITFDKLKAQMARHSGLIENISLSVERWLLPAPSQTAVQKKKRICHKLTWTYIRNNSTSVIFLALFIFINAILFITRAFEYQQFGVFLMLARANGMSLHFRFNSKDVRIS